MATKTLDQVMAELGSVYDPLAGQLQTQQAQIGTNEADQEKGLAAKQSQAFDQILGQARQRGLGFSGIPVGEQYKYNATDYMPALANMQTQAKQQQSDLTTAILNLNKDRRTQAQSIYDTGNQQDLAERQYQESVRQFNANQELQRQQMEAAQKAASAASSFSPSIGNYMPSTGGTPKPAAPAAPQYIGNNDLRGHLLYQAQNGNNDAKIALTYVGNDGRYSLNPTITNPAILQALSRIGAVNVYAAPSAKAPAPGSSFSNVGIGGQKLNFGF